MKEQWLELASSATNVRYLKVLTTQRPSWVAWAEIEVYANVTPAASSIQWLIADQLGTARMTIDKTGTLSNIKRHDYFPFGEEVAGDTTGRNSDRGYASDTLRQKFTGYERDNETSLDYAKARYYSNMQGRFTSNDPLMASGKTGIPQSWNRYSYVLNNPLKFVDPSGKIWAYHYLNGDHTRWGVAWYDSKKEIPKKYHEISFGKEGVLTLTGTDGRAITLKANSRIAEISGETRTPASNQDTPLPAANVALINATGRLTEPMPKATAAFVLTGAAVGGGAGAIVYATGTAAGSGVTTLGIDSFAATTSGAATDTAVIGSLEATGEYAGQAGYNTLQVPNGAYTFEGVNAPWLDSIIRQGQTVLVKAGGIGTALEIEYLERVGGYVREGDKLIPPH